MDRYVKLCQCYFVFLVTIAIVVTEKVNETESFNLTDITDEILNNDDVNCLSSSIHCLAFCCPSGSYVVVGGCSEDKGARVELPNEVYDLINDTQVLVKNVTVDETSFNFKLWNPCRGLSGYMMFPDEDEDDESILMKNGSIYKPPDGSIIAYGKYCFAAYEDVAGIAILVCPDNPDSGTVVNTDDESKPFPIGMILSIVFFIPTFIVYSVLPELKNLHGLNLRAYVGCLAISYTLLAFIQLVNQKGISDSVCVLMGIHNDHE